MKLGTSQGGETYVDCTGPVSSSSCVRCHYYMRSEILVCDDGIPVGVKRGMIYILAAGQFYRQKKNSASASMYLAGSKQ